MPEHLPEDLLAGAGWLVVDGNLRGATVARALALAAAAHVPVALDPVGVAKAARLGGLTGVHTFTPNVDELAAWSGRPGVEAGVRAAQEQGVGVVWLREGPAGSRLFRPGVAAEVVRLRGAEVVDVTGAGDAMLAAYVHRMTHDGDPVAAAWSGAAAAWLTVASPWAVRPDLSEALVERTLTELRTA
jgi:pseudouridine kinase